MRWLMVRDEISHLTTQSLKRGIERDVVDGRDEGEEDMVVDCEER